MLKGEEAVSEAYVKNGEKNSVDALAKQDINIPVLTDDIIETKVNLKAEITAPVKKDEVIGYAEIFLNKEKICEVELIASESIEKLYIPTFFDNFKMILESIF